METLSFNSNQSAWAMAIKNIFVEAIVKQICIVSALSPKQVLRSGFFQIFFRKFCLLIAMVTNRIKRLQQ